MKKSVGIWLVVGMSLFLGYHFLPLSCGTTVAASEELIWGHDLQQGIELANQQKKHVLVDFDATWCFWCKRMKATTYRDKQVVKLLNRKFIAVSIDGDKNQDLVRKFQVRGFPTTVILDGEGKTVENLAGYVPPSEFLSWLKDALDE